MTNPFANLFDKVVPDSAVNPALTGSEGGGGFQKIRYGSFTATHLFRIYTQTDLNAPGWNESNVGGLTLPKHAFDRNGFFYYKEQEEAEIAKTISGAVAVNHVVYVSAPVTGILNFNGDISDERWASGIGADVSVVSLTRGKSHKDRVAYHLMYLPSLIEAAAVAMQLTTERPVLAALTELAEAGVDAAHTWDYDYQVAMCGDGLDGLWETKLGKARASLWKALGESDPTRYHAANQKDKPESAGVTTAPLLLHCLKLASATWGLPVWVREVTVMNPVVDAVSKKGNRLSVPCITHFYTDEASAQAAADAETPARASSGPALPAQWTAMRDAWVAQVKDWKSTYPAAIIAFNAEGGQDRTGATLEDLVAWWDAVA